MPIPKLFVQYAAGGQHHLAERLWNEANPKLWGRSPAELWDDKDAPPFKLTAVRSRILAAFRQREPVFPKAVDFQVFPAPASKPRSGNGKPPMVDPPLLSLERSGWESLFGN